MRNEGGPKASKRNEGRNEIGSWSNSKPRGKKKIDVNNSGQTSVSTKCGLQLPLVPGYSRYESFFNPVGIGLKMCEMSES